MLKASVQVSASSETYKMSDSPPWKAAPEIPRHQTPHWLVDKPIIEEFSYSI